MSVCAYNTDPAVIITDNFMKKNCFNHFSFFAKLYLAPHEYIVSMMKFTIKWGVSFESIQAISVDNSARYYIYQGSP